MKNLNEDNLDNIFSEMVQLEKIIITTPISTADAERNFSSMNTIKIRLRSRMDNNRLNALGIFLWKILW